MAQKRVILVALKKVWKDVDGNLVEDGNESAAVLVAARGQRLPEEKLEGLEGVESFFQVLTPGEEVELEPEPSRAAIDKAPGFQESEGGPVQVSPGGKAAKAERAPKAPDKVAAPVVHTPAKAPQKAAKAPPAPKTGKAAAKAARRR